MRSLVAPLIVLMLALSGVIVPVRAQLVRGQVVDSITRAPVPESIVILEGLDGREVDRTISDRRGIFLLRAPVQGSYRLIAMHEGYRRLAFPTFDLELGQILSFVLMVPSRESVRGLPDQGTQEMAAEFCAKDVAAGLPVIVGTVTDALTGEPMAGAQVHLSVPAAQSRAADSRRIGDESRIVETDDEGSYWVCGAPPMSRISLHAIHGRGISSFESLLFGTGGAFNRNAYHPLTRPIWRQDLELFPIDRQSSTLTGSVTDTLGQALGGATVDIVGTPYQTRTDRSGEFEFRDLTHGDIRIQAKQLGYAPMEFDVTIDEADAVVVPDGVLVLSKLSERLADIVITAPAYRSSIEGFLLRRETKKRGRFAVPADWASMKNPTLSKILSQIRAFRFQRRGCEGLSTFVDGVYLGGVAVEAFVDFEMIVGVETYAEAIDAPVRYRRHLCGGVMLLWTL